MARYRHTGCGGGWEQTEGGNLRCIKCGEVQKIAAVGRIGLVADTADHYKDEPVGTFDTRLEFPPTRTTSDAAAVAAVRALIAIYKGRKAGLIAINELERAIGDRE